MASLRNHSQRPGSKPGKGLTSSRKNEVISCIVLSYLTALHHSSYNSYTFNIPSFFARRANPWPHQVHQTVTSGACSCWIFINCILNVGLNTESYFSKKKSVQTYIWNCSVVAGHSPPNKDAKKVPYPPQLLIQFALQQCRQTMLAEAP